MFTSITPKLPMRNKTATADYYVNKLGFKIWGGDYLDYLMLEKDSLQIHFFLFEKLDPFENYGQIYIRTNQISKVYQQLVENGVSIHPNGHLENKPWGQKEFSLLDPDNNLITFGQSL